MHMVINISFINYLPIQLALDTLKRLLSRSFKLCFIKCCKDVVAYLIDFICFHSYYGKMGLLQSLH
jgi:hypothetical protein